MRLTQWWHALSDADKGLIEGAVLAVLLIASVRPVCVALVWLVSVMGGGR